MSETMVLNDRGDPSTNLGVVQTGAEDEDLHHYSRYGWSTKHV